MAYCPSCKSFRIECNPDPEEYSYPCTYYDPFTVDEDYEPVDCIRELGNDYSEFVDG